MCVSICKNSPSVILTCPVRLWYRNDCDRICSDRSVLKSRRNVLLPSLGPNSKRSNSQQDIGSKQISPCCLLVTCTLKVEEIWFPEAPIKDYRNIRRHIPYDSTRCYHRLENLNSTCARYICLES
jgi:hypothetical protein